MNEKEIEQRRREVEELKLKGYKQSQIADKLDVSEQTISADVKAINERYKKFVTENPYYLEKRIDKILEWLDKYDKVLQQLYELKDATFKVKDGIQSIVNRYIPSIPKPAADAEGHMDKKELKKYLDKERERLRFSKELNSLAKSNTSDQIGILREIRSTLSEQAKILQLITGNKTYVQQNFIHIDKIQLIMNKIKYIVEKYITEDKRKEVYGILKNINLEE
jgi:transposase